MSLRGDKYETVDEVKARLEHTVVLYDSQPVYISSVMMPEGEDEIARVYFYPLPLTYDKDSGRPRGVAVRKYLSSKKFDLTPFKMGFMNHKGSAINVTRIPVRQYKQGLSSTTASFTDLDGGRNKSINFASAISSQSFVDMINNDYPAFDEVIDKLGPKTHSIALSRRFALLVDPDIEAMFLYHGTNKCGLCLLGEKALRVPDKFRFLREAMEEVRIPIT
jgi:hypothetical protein